MSESHFCTITLKQVQLTALHVHMLSMAVLASNVSVHSQTSIYTLPPPPHRRANPCGGFYEPLMYQDTVTISGVSLSTFTDALYSAARCGNTYWISPDSSTSSTNWDTSCCSSGLDRLKPPCSKACCASSYLILPSHHNQMKSWKTQEWKNLRPLFLPLGTQVYIFQIFQMLAMSQG